MDTSSLLSYQRRTMGKGIVGKTINRVLMRCRETDIPKCQLLFEFTDGTTFEFYCSTVIQPAKGLCCDNSIMCSSDGIDVFDWKFGE